MAKHIVRFLCAYRGEINDFKRMLQHELKTSKERCATSFFEKDKKLTGECKIALEFPTSAVIKKFQYDCWSISCKDGTLARGEENPYSFHNEIWVKGRPVAVLVAPDCHKKVKATAMALAKMNGLPCKVVEFWRLSSSER